MIKKQRTSTEYTPLLYHKESIPTSSTVRTTSPPASIPMPCTITLLLSTFIPSLAGLVCGYDRTIMESILALPNFQHHYFYGNLLIGDYNPFDYLISGHFVMAIFGTIYAGHICDQAGRKRSLVGAFLLFAFGTFLDVTTGHSLVFLTGRLIVGFGSGIMLVAAVCMVTELAPANSRGSLVGFISLLTLAGQLSGYYVMVVMRPRITESLSSSSTKPFLFLHYSLWSYSWRTPILLETCVCLLAILVQWRLPDSPRWLMWTSRYYQGNGETDTTDDGLLAMAYLQETSLDDPMVQQQWKQIIADYDSTGMYITETQSYMDYLFLLMGTNRRHPKTMPQPEFYYTQQQRKRRLLLVCGVMLANSVTGYDMLVKHYASAIFYASGLHETSLLAANGCKTSIALGVMAISLGWCVDYFGRRNFLLIGGLMMALSYIGLGGTFQWSSVVDWQTGSVLLIGARARIMAIICVYTYIVVYSFSWNSLVLVTTCEWLSVRDRAKGMALVVCTGWLYQWCLAAFSRFVFMSPLIYYSYGMSLLLSCYFVYRWIPNITAKSLEEIAGMVL